jgi:hypothetical protein
MISCFWNFASLHCKRWKSCRGEKNFCLMFDDVTRSVSEGECSVGLVDGEAFWSVRPR